MENQIATISQIFNAYESKSIKGDAQTITVHLEGHVHAADLFKLEGTGFEYLKRSGTGVTLTFKVLQDAV